MLKIDDKVFLNVQEAVGWLLANNCIPFQCTAPYAANTEIGMGTIVNPSPAKIRIGSIIFFSDSKVSTVTGITQNGFIVSDEYNDLVDDVIYVSNVAINASGHLIVTLSNDEQIDAGLIKQVSGFSINGSQHLIVAYNDGSTTDLGAIFTGNVNINGNLTANSIIENMAGYAFSFANEYGYTYENVYVGAVKNGNKLTLVCAFNITRTEDDPTGNITIGNFTIPSAVGVKLYSTTVGQYSYLANQIVVAWKEAWESVELKSVYYKNSNTDLSLRLIDPSSDLTKNTKYYIRCEVTFTLSNSLV